ncbi:MAG: GGDEF domain-containing protein [Nitrospinae bacterium]|nr:GGDEF domain-containing protein [Nitrospinota bacterium]
MEKNGKDESGFNDSQPEFAAVNPEFADRVIRLLIVCAEGISRFIEEKDGLYAKLGDLIRVLKKAIRHKPISDLGKEIQDFFSRKKLEDDFRATEKEEIKAIVIDLTQTLTGMVSSSGEFGVKIGNHIEKIEKAASLDDWRSIKVGIVSDLQKIRNQSLTLREELERYRRTTANLSERLEQSEAKALIDPLTNILNRNAYDLKIGQLMREFHRYKEPAALMVADIDYFKKLNDKYGHKAGDRILVSVASAIKESIRESDSLFRYGGEEFVILLNRIDLDNAKKLAEKIRFQLERDYFVDGDIEIKVTVSLGLTAVHEGDTEQSLFDRADRAMYISKRSGRNRVTVAE